MWPADWLIFCSVARTPKWVWDPCFTVYRIYCVSPTTCGNIGFCSNKVLSYTALCTRLQLQLSRVLTSRVLLVSDSTWFCAVRSWWRVWINSDYNRQHTTPNDNKQCKTTLFTQQCYLFTGQLIPRKTGDCRIKLPTHQPHVMIICIYCLDWSLSLLHYNAVGLSMRKDIESVKICSTTN